VALPRGQECRDAGENHGASSLPDQMVPERQLLPAGATRKRNADLIASGLSPVKSQLAAIAAVLHEIDRLAAEKADFAFETTLSGLGHMSRLRALTRVGYRIEIVYLRLRSVRLAVRRVAARVKQGGHDVPRRDVIRRFSRSSHISAPGR
jgi:predicted ABC-type ATPase